MASSHSSRHKARGQSTAHRVEAGPRTTLVNSTIRQSADGQKAGVSFSGRVQGTPHVAQVGVGPGAHAPGLNSEVAQEGAPVSQSPPTTWSAPGTAPQGAIGWPQAGAGQGVPPSQGTVMVSPPLTPSPAIPMPSAQAVLGQGLPPQAGLGQGIQMPSPQAGAGQGIPMPPPQAGYGQGMPMPSPQAGFGQGIQMPPQAGFGQGVQIPPQAGFGQGVQMPPQAGFGQGIQMPPQAGFGPGIPMPSPQAGFGPGIQMPPPQPGIGQGIPMPSAQAGQGRGIPMPSPQAGFGQGIPWPSPQGGPAASPPPNLGHRAAGSWPQSTVTEAISTSESAAVAPNPTGALPVQAGPRAEGLATGSGHPVTVSPATVTYSEPSSASDAPPFTPPPPAPAAQQYRFLMTSQGLPGLSRLGAAPTGEVLLTGRPGEGYAIAGSLYGMPPLSDRSLVPTLWLLHDLTVPLDIAPADLAALPQGNQSGLLFTQDGRPPSFGPQANVITIAVPVGSFEPTPEGTWQVNAVLSPTVNQTFHPLAALGPNELQDPNQAMPSGTMTAVLTDLFLRPATLLPHLRVREQHAERLRAICQSWALRPAQHLDGAAFTRVAVTLEGPVRSTPSRMPTQEALILWGNNRAQLS